MDGCCSERVCLPDVVQALGCSVSSPANAGLPLAGARVTVRGLRNGRLGNDFMLIHKRLAWREEGPCEFEVRQCVMSCRWSWGPDSLHRPVWSFFLFQEMGEKRRISRRQLKVKRGNGETEVQARIPARVM